MFDTLKNMVKRHLFSSIRGKIFILFIIISLLPLLILTSINYIYSVSLIKDEISRSNKALLIKTGQNLDNMLETIEDKMWSFVILDMQNSNKYVNNLGVAVNNDGGQALDNLKVATDILQSYADTNKYIDSIYLYSTGGKILVTSKRSTIVSWDAKDADWYQKAGEGKGKVVWITTRPAQDIDANLKKMMLSAALQIRDNMGNEIGVLCVNLKEGIISDLVSDIDIGKNGYILISDSYGNIINHRNAGYISGNMMEYEYVKRITEGDNGYFENYIDGENYIITFLTSQYTGWRFAAVISDSEIKNKVYQKVQVSILLSLICIPVAVIFSIIISKSLYTPIKKLKSAMKKAADGDFDTRIEDLRKDEFSELNVSFNVMVEKINNTIKELYKARLLKKEAELKALQSQINPHFLYNTLDSMYWMARLGRTDELSTMITSFSKFLKINLNKGKDIISVKDVISEIQYYLTIQKFRFGDKFDAVIDVEQELYQYSMIKFLMQPLVENAIYHGIERKKGRGLIRIIGRKVDDYAKFSVIDDGVGMSPERLAVVRESIDNDMQDANFALVNVSKRIKTIYGEGFHLLINSEEGKGTAIDVIIPLMKYEDSAGGYRESV